MRWLQLKRFESVFLSIRSRHSTNSSNSLGEHLRPKPENCAASTQFSAQNPKTITECVNRLLFSAVDDNHSDCGEYTADMLGTYNTELHSSDTEIKTMTMITTSVECRAMEAMARWAWRTS